MGPAWKAFSLLMTSAANTGKVAGSPVKTVPWILCILAWMSELSASRSMAFVLASFMFRCAKISLIWSMSRTGAMVLMDAAAVWSPPAVWPGAVAVWPSAVAVWPVALTVWSGVWLGCIVFLTKSSAVASGSPLPEVPMKLVLASSQSVIWATAAMYSSLVVGVGPAGKVEGAGAEA